MKCPRCVQKIHRGAESCPRCGFVLHHADALFVDVPRSMPALADRAGLMRMTERNHVSHAMKRFSSRFPDLFFALYTGVFRNHENMRIGGFWVLNRAKFEDQPQRPNDSCVLLIMDVERKAATLSFGYHLDAYLDEEDTFFCLSKAHPHWLEARYADGIVALIAALESILIKRSLQARRNSQRFAQRVLSPSMVKHHDAVNCADGDATYQKTGKEGES